MLKGNSFFEKKILNTAVTTWFIVAVLGQWIFGLYVALFYGNASATGHIEEWNKVLPHGYVPGETMGNIVVGLHLLLAVIIIIGGPLQLMPKMRKYMPDLHKWTGRFYILSAYIISLSGLYMVWVRGSIGGKIQHISISINAMLIMIFATFTIRHAIVRDIKSHRIWAIRLFLVMNGVWFFRIGLNFWLFINRRPVGFDPKTFEGPFLYFLTFSQYIIPLVLFELYSKALKSKNKQFILIISVILTILTLVMAIGIYAASKSIWLPKMGEALHPPNP